MAAPPALARGASATLSPDLVTPLLPPPHHLHHLHHHHHHHHHHHAPLPTANPVPHLSPSPKLGPLVLDVPAGGKYTLRHCIAAVTTAIAAGTAATASVA